MAVKQPALGRIWLTVLFVLLVALSVHWWQRIERQDDPITIRRTPVGVMGTSSTVVAVLRYGDAAHGARALDAAEAELRHLESIFSTWIELSELSKINAAAAGQEIRLSPQVLDLLRRSRQLHSQTGGTFDITARPLIERWREGVAAASVPGADELAAARERSSWTDFELGDNLLVKRRSTARLDVDGIAKGYAIDRAITILTRSGAVGGLVEIGGDLRIFGVPPSGTTWPVAIRSPFDASTIGRIEISDGAVCTSGSYARPVLIAGREHSHIIDPRNGSPVSGTASVTVVAPEAATADAWATALSILGTEGLTMLPSGVEALVIASDGKHVLASATPAFPEVLGSDSPTIDRRVISR